MFPAGQGLNLDVEAISGICGSISIACWIVVFSPQIIENFRRSSADGLSLQFIIVWLAGDVFNILGAVLQGVLPTMLILAVYYTLADIVLLGQCFYYRGFTWKDEVVLPVKKSQANSNGNGALPHSDLPSERSALLHPNSTLDQERRGSGWSNIDATHLSPVTPLLDTTKASIVKTEPEKQTSVLKATLLNLFAVLMVCLAGILGWYLSSSTSSTHNKKHHERHDASESLQLNLWGQIFGYFCAVLYLGSRIPQILLNYRRKSTDGISMLFFLFACIGNLTYVLSIFAFSPSTLCHRRKCAAGEAGEIYGRYILVNASWLAGSLGTLFLDAGIFVQFFLYRDREDDEVEDDQAVVESLVSSMPSTPGGDRPLLARGNSTQ